MAPESQERNPYVGPRPFEQEDRGRFFGRDRETNDILSLVIAHRVLLIYAQSGAGKTSLLNARLIPLLEEEGFEALPLARVSSPIPKTIEPEEIPNLYVFNTLMSWAEHETDPGQLAKMSLIGFLKEREHPTDEEGLPSARVVIFDQFEELFTFYPEPWRDREGFFEQVRDALEDDPLLRVVFVIREDYIAQLDPYAPLLPEKLRIRFRLERLDKRAALSAVTGPLAGTKRSFTEGVAEQLVEELLEVRITTAAGKTEVVAGEFVEPVQLQVVCQSLWRDLPPEVTKITKDHLQAFGDVNQALSGFYERSIKRADQKTGVKEGELRAWFEHSLITPAGTRGTVFRGREETGGIPSAAVDMLENLHLIRGERRAGARWYELTHDRFIEPIQESNKTWQTRRWQKAEAAWMQARRWIVGLGAAVLIFAALGLLAWGQRNVAVARELAAMANGQLEVDPELGLLLAIEATETAYTVQAEDALRQALASPWRATLRGHTSSVTSAAYSPDGRWIVTTSRDGTARVWDAESGQQIMVLKHPDVVWSAAYSPDGRWIVTAGGVTMARVWDAGSGQQVMMLKHPDVVWSAVYSPDGRWIVTAGGDGTARVWDAESGRQIMMLKHLSSVHWAAYSPDGRWIVTASGDGTARVWDAESGQQMMLLEGHTDFASSVTYSPDGRWIVTASGDGTARVWDAESGQQIMVLKGHMDFVWSVAYSPDGRWIVTAGEDGTARVWDAQSGQKKMVLWGHTGCVRSAAYSPDGRWIVTAGWDGTAQLWDAGGGQQKMVLKHASPVESAAYSPDGRWIVTASRDGMAQVWDTENGQQIMLLKGHTSPVFSATYSPDSQWVVTASEDETARVWDAGSGRQEMELKHTDSVMSAAYSPDRRWIVTAGWDGTAQVWDAENGQQMVVLRHPSFVDSAAYSLDGRWIVTAGGDRMARVWDAESGQQKMVLQGHTEYVSSATYSPDGRWIVTASGDRTARVWDAESGQQMIVLQGHADYLSSVAYSPNGRWIVTASDDNTARVWDAESGQQMMVLQGHAGYLSSVAYSPNGRWIVTASGDGTVRMWPWPDIENLLAEAKSRVTRELSAEERRRFLHEGP